jgi:transposase
MVAIKPMLPNKPRGVPRVNDRRVLNGIFRVLRSGAPWRDPPDHFGPYTTCYNRFVRWRRTGVWGRMGQADDPMSVVGTEGRVKGIQGLRVVDASIFPVVPCANTNLPVLMSAEKIADSMMQG